MMYVCFFKQKTAYEMRISDWSSDVCSSDLEGASYSSNAASNTSRTLPDWGIFYAMAEIRPESADTFFRIAREIIADMAAKPAATDEFARAQNPDRTRVV